MADRDVRHREDHHGDYLAARLRQVGRKVEVLDENELADDFWGGAGETKEERNIGVRRLGLVANLLTRNNVAPWSPRSAPTRAAREENRRLIGRYVEVYVDCPTEKLIQRDTTGKYKKALSGEIPNFIGITEPYEPPNSPEVTIHSDTESVEDGRAASIFQALLDLGLRHRRRAEDHHRQADEGQPAGQEGRAADAKAPAKAAAKGARRAPAARPRVAQAGQAQEAAGKRKAPLGLRARC